MLPLKPKLSRPQGPRRDDRIAVPCCTCGRPTSLRVGRAMLEEVEIFHLCPACFRGTPTEAASTGA